ncbi:L-rhamnose mutarotase [Streptomyces sp. NBC_00988]|uniref:L-rhamnose mutarotase n=1 Tax=Streptomyces sp. NBC_00988 TaxID=2903704 RepID=UPI00386406FC|nr:L-rhamnose mutarotase [Streptomyces sp. NBC_00988]
MRRIAQTIRLRPERRQEYLALHAAVWPGVEATLRRAGIRDYSIFLHGDILFGHFEYVGEDFEADMAAIAADPETQRWWKLTDPCQEPWPDRGTSGQWSEMTEIWRLSENPSDVL